MNRSQIHLLVNSLLTAIVLTIAVSLTFPLIQNGWLKEMLLTFLFIGSLYFAHKAAPHLTGRLVEKFCDHFGVER